MNSLGRHILLPTAVGLGIASLAYGGYRYVRSRSTTDIGSSSTSTRTSSSTSPRTNQSGRITTSRSAPELDSHEEQKCLSPRALQLIFDAENQFFKGLNKMIELTPKQLQTIQTNVGLNGTTLYDILFELRGKRFFENKAMLYKEKIKLILSEAEIDISDEVLNTLDLLEENVREIIYEEKVTSFEYDIVVISADDDHQIAVDFCTNLEENFKDLNITLIEEIAANKTVFRSIENIFQITIYVFIMVTSNFKGDALSRYIGEIGLLESIQNPQANWRVVPVWMEEEVNTYGNCPAEFSTLIGLDYWRCLETQSEGSPSRCLEIIKRLLRSGRKNCKPTGRNIQN